MVTPPCLVPLNVGVPVGTVALTSGDAALAHALARRAMRDRGDGADADDERELSYIDGLACVALRRFADARASFAVSARSSAAGRQSL